MFKQIFPLSTLTQSPTCHQPPCHQPITHHNSPSHSPLCMLMSTPAVNARRAASRPSAAKPWWISSSSAV